MRTILAALLIIDTPPPDPAAARGDALALEQIVNDQYAYLERLPGHRFSLSPKLRSEALSVSTPRELVRYSERALALLADHHAITGASLKDSWAVFPSYGDLWIAPRGGRYFVEEVREGSPAVRAGVRRGDQLVSIDAIPVAKAVADFWTDLGTVGGGERDGYAARVLAAGRRDKQRSLTMRRGGGPDKSFLLPNLYGATPPNRPSLTPSTDAGALVIRLHDSLGDTKTIGAFDRAMATAKPGQPILIDLTDTASGGNTTVARAILGWFVKRPTAYQIHNLPAEERRTGIARQWVEQVLPRKTKYHSGKVTIRVGRWTGSMGEGLAIGFHALGARIEGTRMAGLLGAVYDHPLPKTGIVIKLPTERLFSVDSRPRESYVPKPVARPRL
ncbi:MAG: PDZ domain-containing protein [Sphingomicrobium sp.]